MTDWNRYFRRIAISHQLTKHDVVECCRLGGLVISGSKAEAWKRSASNPRRHAEMTGEEFEVFTRGLVDWAREAYRDTDQ